ncbi:hypothetical protein CF65_02828 [Aggregatibacter actinomycetemcomitans HK1651]|nr:hypothetical protein CF65_02828 [Aggregatibacter actinomycetemcomitans HK1651]
MLECIKTGYKPGFLLVSIRLISRKMIKKLTALYFV